MGSHHGQEKELWKQADSRNVPLGSKQFSFFTKVVFHFQGWTRDAPLFTKPFLSTIQPLKLCFHLKYKKEGIKKHTLHRAAREKSVENRPS